MAGDLSRCTRTQPHSPHVLPPPILPHTLLLMLMLLLLLVLVIPLVVPVPIIPIPVVLRMLAPVVVLVDVRVIHVIHALVRGVRLAVLRLAAILFPRQ